MERGTMMSTKFSNRAFSVAGLELWNHLPQSMRKTTTVGQIKRKL